MKKLLLGFLLAVSAFAAGSVSQSVSPLGRSIVSGQTVVTSFVIQLQWTGDASTGSVPSTVIQNLQQLQGYQITQVQIIPNTPAPTAGYSVKITDVSGYDMLEGQAASSSATAATSYATSSKVPPIVGALNLVVTGNSVASAQGRVLVYAYKPSVIAAVNLLGTGGTSGGGTVTSVFNRTGAVTATSGDYSASQVSNAPSGGIAATDVQTAITELDTEKQATGNYITALTGDATASGPGSAAMTLATVNTNPGSCGDSTHICQVTLNAKGLATAATAVAISAGSGTVTVVSSGSLGSTQCVTGGGTTTLQTPSANCTVDSSGNLVVNSISTGSSAPLCVNGTAGLLCLKEGTAGTGEASAALLYTKTDHLLYANLNNGGEVQVPTATSTATLTNKTLTAPVISTISNTGTLTLPTSTDTLVGKATTDTFTNKTFDTAGTGNSFKINGTAITAVSGTGAVCLATGSACAGGGTPATGGSSWLWGPMIGSGEILIAFTSPSSGEWFPWVANAPTIKNFNFRVSTAAASSATGLIFGIYAVSSGLPTGSALCYGTISTLNSTGVRSMAVSGGTLYSAGTCSGLVIGSTYAFVMSTDDGSLKIEASYTGLSVHNEILNATYAHTVTIANSMSTGTGTSIAFTAASGWTTYTGASDAWWPLVAWSN